MQASTQVNFGVGCRVLSYDQHRNFRSNGGFTYPAHCRTEACRLSALLCKTDRAEYHRRLGTAIMGHYGTVKT